MSNNASALLPHSMNGGNGSYSYTKNSQYQRKGSGLVKKMIDEYITEKLDVTSLNTFSLADFGCSVGPNTVIAMQNLVEAISNKHLLQNHPKSDQNFLEFHAFFNDHVSNDFNTLFASLPAKRRYFAFGVPGSFHARLFPDSSLHVAYSSYALQWLSRAPLECLDEGGSAWNGGRIQFGRAPQGVVEAYAAQFGRDMDAFLEARAKEIVVGGILILIFPGKPDDVPHSRLPNSLIYEFMGSILMDMTKKGLLHEDQVNSFNLPIYTASPKEVQEAVERNGEFIVEKLEMTDNVSAIGGSVDWKVCTMHCRAGLEAILAKHFG